jgi:hypothetical protein
VSDERLMEMAPLYALGALDGDELAEFARSLPASPGLQAEAASFEAVVGRLAFVHATGPPSARLRARTLGAADGGAESPDMAGGRMLEVGRSRSSV